MRRRIELMPMAALASSPVERDAKNRVGSLNRRSHTAGWSALSILPSMRRIVRFCSSMNAADTMLVTMTARETCTIRSVWAFGTYTPSTRPVATGTKAPIATVTRPASSRLRTSARVPRALNRSSRSGLSARSGSGRYSMTARGSNSSALSSSTRVRRPLDGCTASYPPRRHSSATGAPEAAR